MKIDKNRLSTMPNLFDGQNSKGWLHRQPQVADMRKRYGGAEKFLNTFTPELQPLAAKAWVRAYIGTAPTLEVVSLGYGEQVVIVWLCLQLENINSFAGAKEKMTVARQKELAKLILTEYEYLKVSELLLFFHRLKCGKYGRFYGTVDALFISSALLQFVDERRTDLKRIKAATEKQQQAAQQATPQESKAITYEEYLELKKQKQQKEDSK